MSLADVALPTQAWGRFTAEGGPEVEARVHAVMGEVQRALGPLFVGGEARAVVLLGGYGRGEGGVDRRDGVELPHNNFDFLVILRDGGTKDSDWKSRADAALAPLIARHGIGMDVGVIREAALANSPVLVMWYDMRHGHKTIIGDASFVPSLSQFRLEAIPAWDVRNLLVNRGTLLVINEAILARGGLTDDDKRTVIKHAMKAIIGYGDALLYFHGAYDWSYVEKRRRMAALADAPAAVRALYDEAMGFRFRPDYPAYLHRDLAEWNQHLCESLASVHLACERRRLRLPALTWTTYGDAAFAHALTEDWQRPRAVAKKLVAAVSSADARDLSQPKAKLGYRASRPRERLPLVFPFVAYPRMPKKGTDLAARTLHASGAEPAALRRAYLRTWGEVGDTNFDAVLRKLRIDVTESEAS